MAKKKEKKKFDWNEFANKHVAVHLQTVEEAKKFSEILHRHGYSWYMSGSCLNYPHCAEFIGRLCFYAKENKWLTCGHVERANEEGHEIRMFSAYDFD